MNAPDQPLNRPDGIRGKAQKGRRSFSPGDFRTMVAVGGFVLLIALLVIRSNFSRSAEISPRIEAINNAKQIGLALLEFESDYGEYPSAATLPEVLKDTGSRLDFSGPSSNAQFRQLIAAYGLKSEYIFYCEHPEGVSKPDNVLGPGRALEPGEVGFSYVAGLKRSMNLEIPILMAPMKIGTECFWPKPYGGKGVILRLDNSADALLVRSSDGKALLEDGKTLFDTGPGAVWPTGHVIDLRHPAK